MSSSPSRAQPQSILILAQLGLGAVFLGVVFAAVEVAVAGWTLALVLEVAELAEVAGSVILFVSLTAIKL